MLNEIVQFHVGGAMPNAWVNDVDLWCWYYNSCYKYLTDSLVFLQVSLNVWQMLQMLREREMNAYMIPLYSVQK